MSADSPLESLIGAYLNQDVWDFYPDVMAGVDDFMKDEPDLAKPLMVEIEQLLADHPEEADVAELMRRLGAGFIPAEDGYRGWLVRIASHVRSRPAVS